MSVPTAARRRTSLPLWLFAVLVGLVALVGHPAAAHAATLAGTRVGASTLVDSTGVGLPPPLVADRQPGNGPTYDGLASGTPVATEEIGLAAPSRFLPTERLGGAADRQEISGLADSMRANGWQGKPIDVAQSGDDLFILNGHHRVAAAAQAGIDVPYAVRDLPFAYKQSVWQDIDSVINAWANP